MQTKPTIAQKQPTAVTVEAGKTYAWCTCGISVKQPFCDGQHKTLATQQNGETVMPFKSLRYEATETKELWFCNCKHTKTPPFCDGSHNSL
jgi:CDGSH iron-sulfur domain-containing protein 3